MSTPTQRGTKALDEMRKFIYDQASPAIADNPALISEFSSVRTPHEIELILTKFSIDIDSPISAPVLQHLLYIIN